MLPVRSSNNAQLHYTDPLGSVVHSAKRSAAQATNSYDEFGIPGEDNAGRFQFTGQVWIPEIGMYYYKARMYSPTLGRFLQPDPIGYGDGLNIYNYVGGDPVNSVDPTGFFCTFINNKRSVTIINKDKDGNDVEATGEVANGVSISGCHSQNLVGGAGLFDGLELGEHLPGPVRCRLNGLDPTEVDLARDIFQSEAYLNAAREALTAQRETGAEHSFFVVQNGNRLSTSPIISGTPRRVGIAERVIFNQLRRKNRVVVWFHTHPGVPGRTVQPSLNDVTTGNRRGELSPGLLTIIQEVANGSRTVGNGGSCR